MTNPLLKVTLILLSLMSAVFIGQAVLSSAQSSSLSTQAMSNQSKASPGSDFEGAATQPSLEQSAKNHTATDAATVKDAKPGRKSRRSFSFHYLDILEWLFAGRGEKARQRQSQRPSATLSGW